MRHWNATLALYWLLKQMVKYDCLWTWIGNKALIRPVYRGLTLNDIFPRLAGIKYITELDASSGYNNLKLDKRSSYLTKFSCPFGRHRYIRSPFRTVSAGYMFQEKTDELFSGMLNAFGIADNILIEGFNEQGNDHDEISDKVLLICKQANFKLNKDKVSFKMKQHSLLWLNNLMTGCKAKIQGKFKYLLLCCHKIQKRTAVVPGCISNYLSKLSPTTAQA